METVKENSGMCCPNCGEDDQIDILARVWVRLTPDGASPEQAYDGSVEYGPDAAAYCHECDHRGTAETFTVKEEAT